LIQGVRMVFPRARPFVARVAAAARMTRALALAWTVTAACALTACGHKGDLVHPATADAPVVRSTVALAAFVAPVFFGTSFAPALSDTFALHAA